MPTWLSNPLLIAALGGIATLYGSWKLWRMGQGSGRAEGKAVAQADELVRHKPRITAQVLIEKQHQARIEALDDLRIEDAGELPSQENLDKLHDAIGKLRRDE